MARGVPSALAPRAVAAAADRPWPARLSQLLRSRRFHRALKGAAVYSVAAVFVYVPALTATVRSYVQFVLLTVVLNPPGVAVGSALQGLTRAVMGAGVGLAALAVLGQLAASPVALAVGFSIYLYGPSYLRASDPSLMTPVVLSLLIPAGSLWRMGVAGRFAGEVFSEAAVAVAVGLGLSLAGSLLLFPEYATDAASAKLTAFLTATAAVTRAFGDEYLYLPPAKSDRDGQEEAETSSDAAADADGPSGTADDDVDAVKDALVARRRAATDAMDAALGALAPAVEGVLLERADLSLATLHASLALCHRIQRTLLAAMVALPFLRRGIDDDDFLRRSRGRFLAHVEAPARALFGAVADYLDTAAVYYEAPTQQLPCVQRLQADMDGLRSLLGHFHDAHQRGLTALWREPQSLPCGDGGGGRGAKSDGTSADPLHDADAADGGTTDGSTVAEERSLLRWEKITRGAGLRYAIHGLVACCGELAQLLVDAQRARSGGASVRHRLVAIRNAFLPAAAVHPAETVAALRRRVRAVERLPPQRSGGTLHGVLSPADAKRDVAGGSSGDDGDGGSSSGGRWRSGRGGGRRGNGDRAAGRGKGSTLSRRPTGNLPWSAVWGRAWQERLPVARHFAHVLLRACVFDAAGRYALKLAVAVLAIHALFLASGTSEWTTRWGGNATLLIVIVHCDPTVGGGLQRMFFLSLCTLFAAAWGWVTLRLAVAAAVTEGVDGARELLALPVVVLSTALFSTGAFYILAKKSRFFYCGVLLQVIVQAITFPGYLYLRNLTGSVDMDAIHAFTLERLSGTGLALGTIFVTQVLVYPNLARNGIKALLADTLLATHACYLLLTSSRAAEGGDGARAVSTAALLTEERALAANVRGLRVQLGFAVAEPRLEAPYPAAIMATLLDNLDAVLSHLTFASLILHGGGVQRVRHAEVRQNVAALRVAISVQLFAVAAAVRAGLALPPRLPDALCIRRKLLCSIVYHVQRLHAEEETGLPPPPRRGAPAAVGGWTPGSGGGAGGGRAAPTVADDAADGIGVAASAPRGASSAASSSSAASAGGGGEEVPAEADTFPFSVNYLAYMGALGDCYGEVANMASAARQLVGSLHPLAACDSDSDSEGTQGEEGTAVAGSGDDTDHDYDGEVNDDFARDLEVGMAKRQHSTRGE